MKIGIFDSGIGGTTVLKELQKLLPDEQYIYYSDSANNPYGNKSHAEIEELSLQATEFLLEKGCEIIVIACNTASAEAAEFLRTRFKDTPIFAIQPALKAVYDSDYDRGKYTLILATGATLNSSKFKELYQKYAIPNTVLIDCNGLAELIEHGKDTKEFLESKLDKYHGQTENVVLGCTHYPLVADTIREVLGSNIKFFNGARGLARNLAESIKDKKSPKGEGNVEFYDTGRGYQDRTGDSPLGRYASSQADTVDWNN